MLYSKKSFFNKVFINGFINDLIQINKPDKKFPMLKLLIASSINSNEQENIIEVFIYKRSLIETCDQWFKLGSNIILDGNIVVSISKSNDSKNMSHRRQFIRIDRILNTENGLEYF